MIGSLNRFIVPDMKKQLTLVVMVFGFGIYVSVGGTNVGGTAVLGGRCGGNA